MGFRELVLGYVLYAVCTMSFAFEASERKRRQLTREQVGAEATAELGVSFYFACERIDWVNTSNLASKSQQSPTRVEL